MQNNNNTVLALHLLGANALCLWYVFHSRQSELLIKLNRLLERCLRNSKCIDTESLCVVAGEKVCDCINSDTLVNYFSFLFCIMFFGL